MPRLKKTDEVLEPAPATVRPRRGRKYVPKHIPPVEETVVEAKGDSDTEVPPVEDVPPPVIKAARGKKGLNALTTNGDLVDIWERRLLNPNGSSNPTIIIKTPGMRLRWINLSNRGRYQRARYEQGWVPVERGELNDEREIYGVSFTTEDYVCRGEKQQEMLMKMPEAVFKKIQQRRAAINKKSYENLRQNMASAGSTHFSDKYGSAAGDQAADVMGKFRGDIKFGTERVTSDELLD